jgi:UDP-GlcNAc:undecaprenyl-phosphate/decaprenyl-phosphate GlcNAc-1-phosphate transferase
VRLAGLAVSLVVAAVFLGPWLRDMARSGLARQNYRGRAVAFPAGAVLVACSLIALVPLAVLDDRADLDLLDPELRRWAVYVLGVALLGLMDDALGRGPDAAAPRGWRAHARAVAAGRFSTGFIKAVGALGLAAYATSGLGRHDLGYVADLVLLLLTTNLFNLLDLRPGRVEKVFVALLAGLCIGAWTVAPLDLLGLFIGPVLVGAAFTLRERAMLGDTGSNLVGALAGISLLITLGDGGRIVALVLVAALNVYGEFRSISRTIEGIPLLRSLDSWGRLTEGQEADPGR